MWVDDNSIEDQEATQKFPNTVKTIEKIILKFINYGKLMFFG